MLIEELIGDRLIIEDGAIELQHEIDDIILRARKGEIYELTLDDITGELNKSRPELYIDPRDEEFKQTLIDVLQQSDWISHADPGGRVVLKKPEEMLPGEEEPGSEMQRAQDRQHDKVQKNAMKDVRNGDL